MRVRRPVPPVLLAVVLLVLSAGCGHRAYRLVTASTAVSAAPKATVAPPARPAPHAAQSTLRQPSPTTTTRPVPVTQAQVPPSPTTTLLVLVVPPGPQGGPTPVSAHRCTGTVETEIERVFGEASPWASSVAWRESRCVPGARNPSGSEGLMQLFHHDDLLSAACPELSPSVSWAIPRCNLAAAYVLYRGAGVRPWAL